MQKVNNTIDVNNQIIEETSKEMDKIHKDVETVNEIYKDLALLIQEQGTHINTIADNIEKSLEQTDQAIVQLEKASIRQKKQCLKM